MAKYFLNIHYRSISAMQDEAAASPSKSPGHPYVSLKSNDNEEFFGLYSPGGVMPVGTGKVETGEEKKMHLLVNDLSKKINENVMFTKQVEITEEQYNKGINYARKRVSEPNFYILGLQDCVDFTQSVYNACGLPLFFTHVYSSEELSQLPGLAANKMLLKYGSRDIKNDMLIVEGLSREGVATSLNVPVDRVELIPKAPTSLIAENLTTLNSFRIKVEKSEILPERLIKTIFPTSETDKITQDSPLLTSRGNIDEIKSITDHILSLTLGKWKVLEKLQELDGLVKKVVDSLKEHEATVQDKLKEFVKTKNNILSENQEKCNLDTNGMIEQISRDLDAYNNQMFQQKQAELSAETSTALAQARAAGQSSFSNAGIAARKQSEYQSLVDQYKAQCEAKIKSLKSNGQEKCVELKRAIETEISNKIETIKTEAKRFTDGILVQLQEVKESIIRGEDVDLGEVFNNIQAKISSHLEHVKQIAGNTTVANAVYEILYDNPLLNHPKLITGVAENFGVEAVNELIRLGKNLKFKKISEFLCDQCAVQYCGSWQKNCHLVCSLLDKNTLLQSQAGPANEGSCCGEVGYYEAPLRMDCMVCRVALFALCLGSNPAHTASHDLQPIWRT